MAAPLVRSLVMKSNIFAFNRFPMYLNTPQISPLTTLTQAVPSLMLYSSPQFAWASSFRGLNSTANSSLTAKTVSFLRYSQSLSKICVVSCLYPEQRTCN